MFVGSKQQYKQKINHNYNYRNRNNSAKFYNIIKFTKVFATNFCPAKFPAYSINHYSEFCVCVYPPTT